jgi:hypothetical protein
MTRFARAAHRPLRMVRAPNAALRVGGLFDATLREAVEMTYLWEVPCQLDDRRFVETFGVRATDVGVTIDETIGAS